MREEKEGKSKKKKKTPPSPFSSVDITREKKRLFIVLRNIGEITLYNESLIVKTNNFSYIVTPNIFIVCLYKKKLFFISFFFFLFFSFFFFFLNIIMPNTRRRSVSLSERPSDTNHSSHSLWNSTSRQKSYFLSRFKSNTTPPISPSTSTSTSILPTTSFLPPIQGQQKVKRKPIVTSPTTSLTTSNRKKYETVLGMKSEDIMIPPEDLTLTKKVFLYIYNENIKFIYFFFFL